MNSMSNDGAINRMTPAMTIATDRKAMSVVIIFPLFLKF